MRLTDPEPWTRYFGDGMPSAKSAMQLDAVWSCVRIISETISTLPLSMFERTGKGKQVAGSHQLHFIIHDQPNADSTAAVFWEAMVAAMLLRGAARAEKLMIGTRLVGLRFLNPDCLRKVKLQNGNYLWRYTKDGKQRDIPKDKVWTVPGFTLDGENGVSVIQYGAKVFSAAISAEDAAQNTFKNGLLQTVYYKINAFLTKEQRAEFKRNVAGSVERGELPLLEGGTSAETLGINPGDAQLLESRSFSVEAICRWFRVDPSLVGHGSKDSNWGTGLEQKMIWFLTFTLGPWLKRIEQAISKDLLTVGDRQRYYPKFSVEGLLRADSAARAAFYAAMVNNGIMTRDEVRELEDRPPMGGNAAVLTVQSAMTTLDSVGSSDDAQAVRASLRALLGLDDNPAPRD
ncbi:phage portal protein [Pseudoxanthomonas winnipegensis]|uniref:Phage portal protein n=1 Tax=Pseudoxanthomonas winnipegensis TaxID=2480810 RepID=A0ABY1WCV3_9GAMM|nr:phage portal protein [Pseudoxanthomonas winnipegensis]TAA12470.1 phage portal protein [Pseudoxanthomonas winnipegensis]TAA19165.1 phage portal protein [Pseudoxanthomonas winnipegensis]TAH70426.1 phage portal protein [Pseudoxanthomonas winnipegensis]